MILAPEVMTLLKERGIEDTAVVLGGTIPPNEMRELKKTGIKAVFGPGTPLKDIVHTISGMVAGFSQGATGTTTPAPGAYKNG